MISRRRSSLSGTMLMRSTRLYVLTSMTSAVPAQLLPTNSTSRLVGGFVDFAAAADALLEHPREQDDERQVTLVEEGREAGGQRHELLEHRAVHARREVRADQAAEERLDDVARGHATRGE